jgi:hypothetical protein
MAKHKFLVGVFENDINVGARCVGCGQIALFENGQVPEDIREQECKREDASQAAARIVREATEDH